jgi:septal ring factor EnvC (AmiA/AmiB activator)
MSLEKRIARLERVTSMLVNKGRKLRSEWRDQSRDQAEKINILIHMQMKTDAQIASLAVAQAELTKSQKLTDRALRAFINSLRKRQNGNS